MKQLLLHWGPLRIPAYGFLVGVGIILGMHLATRRAARLGISRRHFLDALIVAALGGVVGASLFHFMFSGGNSSGPGGRSFFGSLVGGAIAGIAFVRWKRIPVLPALDSVFLYIPLGHAIGRIGCWFYGCCHGRICDVSTAMASRYPKLLTPSGDLAGAPAFVRHLQQGRITLADTHSLPVYPTQLYSAALLFLVFFVMNYLSSRPHIKNRPGFNVILYFLLSGTARFIEEFWRDHARYAGLFTNAQVVSLITMVIALLVLTMHKRTATRAVQ